MALISSDCGQIGGGGGGGLAYGAAAAGRTDGQWVCPACSKLNYATRMVCNMRNCRRATAYSCNSFGESLVQL